MMNFSKNITIFSILFSFLLSQSVYARSPIWEEENNGVEVDKMPVPTNICSIYSKEGGENNFVVREEAGREEEFVHFEKAFNWCANQGYSRMSEEDEKKWFNLLWSIRNSLGSANTFEPGKLLTVLSKDASRTQAKVATGTWVKVLEGTNYDTEKGILLEKRAYESTSARAEIAEAHTDSNNNNDSNDER